MRTQSTRFASLVCCGGLVFSCGVTLAQQPNVPPTVAIPSSSTVPPSPIELESLQIVAGDVISVRVFDDPDLDQKNLRVTDSGVVPLLLIGPVNISGLTPGDAGRVIAQAYMDKNILLRAHVQVSLDSIASSDVTVIGNVNGIAGQTTGMAFSLNSPRPLLTVLALAGGLSEKASRSVTIQRHGSGERVTVYLPTDPVKDLDNDPLVYPGDIVVVPRAGFVYVLGNVSAPKVLVMNEDGKLTLLQAMTQAGGPLPTSGLKRVMLFRKENGEYRAVPVNVGQILTGKAHDVSLMPEDALFVPFSYGKNFLVNSTAVTAALASATATGIIYTH